MISITLDKRIIYVSVQEQHKASDIKQQPPFGDRKYSKSVFIEGGVYDTVQLELFFEAISTMRPSGITLNYLVKLENAVNVSVRTSAITFTL